MTKISKKLSALLIVIFFATIAVAQDEEDAALSITGSVDTYYRVNLNSTNDPNNGGIIAPGSSFANLPGFSLGMVNTVISYEGEKVGFVGDLVFGPRGTDAVFGSTTASSSIVNQLYVYWNLSDAATLTFGNFNTYLGYEVISPTANFNYSTSYMFSYGPFSHSGLKADFALGDVSLMVGVFNPTDATDFNPSGDYLGGAQIGFGGAYLNFLFGEDYFQTDLTAGWDLTDAVYLGVNATYNSDLFNGAAIYLQNSFSDSFALGLRGEWFQDTGLGLLTLDESVIDLTLSANYSVGPLTFIPEFRLDSFSEEDSLLLDGDITNPQFGNSLSSFVLAAVYSF